MEESFFGSRGSHRLFKAEICEYVSVSERYLWRECEHVIFVMTGSTLRLRCGILKAKMLYWRPYWQVLPSRLTSPPDTSYRPVFDFLLMQFGMVKVIFRASRAAL